MLLLVDSEFLQILRTAFGRKDYSAVIGHPAFCNRKYLSGLLRCPPPQPSADIEHAVSSLLESIEPDLQDYIHRDLPWPTYTSASTDVRTKDFTGSLDIPMTTPNVPCLLLHGLGHGIVKPEVVSSVFCETQVPTHLVNTPGSGKTRVLFEGLSQSWGFYFVCNKEQATAFGSQDLPWVLENMNPSEPSSFTIDLKTCAESTYEQVHRHHRLTAHRQSLSVLLSRALILLTLLRMAREQYPQKRLDEFRRHWLYLQLRPADILERNVQGEDVFQQLSLILQNACDKYLEKDDYQDREKLPIVMGQIRRMFGIADFHSRLYVVVDEAQEATKKLKAAFRFEGGQAEPPMMRPILCKLAETFGRYGSLIFSGTSLSLIEGLRPMSYNIMKYDPWFRLETDVGSFDETLAQKEYLLRYLPPHLHDTPSILALISRASHWITGRYCFTTNLIQILLQSSFLSPHHALDYVITSYVDILPQDSATFIKDEPKLTGITDMGGEVLSQCIHQNTIADMNLGMEYCSLHENA
ncbi:unnamed protein product [Somion occarium]|uniref:Uncharacterized protein n=1 Tax=Somion occarium TaxID=3059160 RepID=A0ABP1E7P2_9APHY